MNKQEIASKVIQNLDYSDFRNFISIFQKDVFNRNVVDTDGANDGGCDLVTYIDNKEIKRCTQLTIQKSNLKDKLSKDISKMVDYVNKYSYLPMADVFVSQQMSNDLINQLKLEAQKKGLTIEIYDAKRLAQLSKQDSNSFLKNKYKESVGMFGEIEKLGNLEKTLFDCLSIGKDSRDIKEGFLKSVLVDAVYNSADKGILIDNLVKEVQSKIKSLPDKDIVDQINKFKSKGILISPKSDKKKIFLSDEEKDKVCQIYEENSEMENDFLDSLSEILDRHGVVAKTEISDQLLKLHKQYFLSIGNNYQPLKNLEEERSSFENFKEFISPHCKDEKIDALIYDIRDLCKNNSYLSKLGAAMSFSELFKSNKLAEYLNQKTKIVFLDTPILTYLILAWSNLCEENEIEEWNDTYYQSVFRLSKVIGEFRDVILYCPYCYVDEVVGQIIQAKQLEVLEDKLNGDLDDFGGTRNNFYNYYKYLGNYESVESFFEAMGMEGVDDVGLSRNNFKLFNSICEILNQCGVTCYRWYYQETHDQLKKNIETYVDLKKKSQMAIKNDVAQSILLTREVSDYYDEEYDYVDVYLLTWDSSFPKLLDVTLDNLRISSLQHNIIILNPYQFRSKIGMEKFKIQELNVSDGIFCYADQSYGVAHKIHQMLDMLAPLANGKTSPKTLQLIRKIKKEQIRTEENNSVYSPIETKVSYPVEEALSKLIEKIKEFNVEQIWEDDLYSEQISDIIGNIISAKNNVDRDEICGRMVEEIKEKIN